MTTAHRPTWHNALGGEHQGGNRIFTTGKVSARDLTSHTVLKTRKLGQGTAEELQGKNFADDLALKEAKILSSQQISNPLDAITETASSSSDPKARILALEDVNPFPEDADDEPTKANADDDSDDDDDDEMEEEEMELRRELEKIAKEREEEENQKIMKEEAAAAEQQRKLLLRGNPLLSTNANKETSAGWLKRRWDDDVVFKNQAKGLPKIRKAFINDTVRSEFHKKFLAKYIA